MVPTQLIGLTRRLVPGGIVVSLLVVLFLVSQLPQASAETRAEMATHFHFTEQEIALPPGLPSNTIREVNPAYERIQAWISSVGAAVALSDLEGNGVSQDLCLVDTRSDSVIVTPAPNTGARYEPFVVDPAPLPMDGAMAPTGCVPGDYNGDARMDLLVYYMGRTPIMFMARPGATTLDAAAYLPTELVPQVESSDGRYYGPRWQSTAVNVADFDGDGHPDIGIFNYFPDSDVLDPNGQPNVEMNDSFSNATNAGGAHILRWTSATTGEEPSVDYVEQPTAIDPELATGWTLGAGSADLDGDLLPELYLANDFGKDRMFHNASTPGEIRFNVVEGERDALTPKSMVVGHDSFKGMSMEFGDIEGTGRFDMFVSNITTAWGIEESNLVWLNNSSGPEAARAEMLAGRAPYENHAASMNLAFTGWGWDAKIADLNNSGEMEIVQTTGFLKGDVNRWPWLQELAITNDMLLRDPSMWPKAGAGDDIAGDQVLAFWVREPNGRYANLTAELGMDVPIPTRGVAVADADNDGYQEFAVSRQWGPPVFYRNDAPADQGAFLGLRLYRPIEGATAEEPAGLQSVGSPAYGAVVRVTTADGRTRVAQLDGGSGHSGKRSLDVFFGLGDAGSAPVSAEMSWRDVSGNVHTRTLSLTPGWHTFILDAQAQEVTAP